jgi:hypothetical protein
MIVNNTIEFHPSQFFDMLLNCYLEELYGTINYNVIWSYLMKLSQIHIVVHCRYSYASNLILILECTDLFSYLRMFHLNNTFNTTSFCVSMYYIYYTIHGIQKKNVLHFQCSFKCVFQKCVTQ